MKIKLIERDFSEVVLDLPSVFSESSLLSWIGSVVRSNSGRRLTEGMVACICDSIVCDRNDVYDIRIDLIRGLVFSGSMVSNIKTFLLDDRDLRWDSNSKSLVSQSVSINCIDTLLADIISSHLYSKGAGIVLEIEDFLNDYDGEDNEKVLKMKGKMCDSGLL